MLPPLKPIPIKERLSMLFLEKGELDVLDGTFVVVDKNGVRTQIPVGGVACLMLEPGTRVSHAAVTLASRVGCLLIWVGEAGVRLYSSGQPGGARSDRLLYQAKLALDDAAKLKIVRKMFEFRFKEVVSSTQTIEQLRGVEGARVKKMYELLAQRHRIIWKGRNYDQTSWGSGDLANRCLSSATACLYGVTEAGVLAAGYSPAIGFIHSGRPLSFVYDIADLFKFETVVPVAFRIAAESPADPEGRVRRTCRDVFRDTKLLAKIIPTIEQILSAGEIQAPEESSESISPVILTEGDFDVNRRS